METSATTQTIATFTGTLIKRERLAGHRLVQLVFREDDQNWLCVSANLADDTLPLGGIYQVEGEFRNLGERPYIHNPTITPLQGKRVSLQNLGLSVVVVLVVACLTAGGVRAVNGNLAPTSADPGQAAHQVSASQTSQTAATGANQPTASTATPTPAAPPPTPKKTTAKTAAATTTGSVAPAVTPVVPDCDVITTGFGKQFVDDPTQLIGDSTITQVGIDGQTQTCYPNGRSQAGYLQRW